MLSFFSLHLLRQPAYKTTLYLGCAFFCLWESEFLTHCEFLGVSITQWLENGYSIERTWNQIISYFIFQLHELGHYLTLLCLRFLIYKMGLPIMISWGINELICMKVKESPGIWNELHRKFLLLLMLLLFLSYCCFCYCYWNLCHCNLA